MADHTLRFLRHDDDDDEETNPLSLRLSSGPEDLDAAAFADSVMNAIDLSDAAGASAAWRLGSPPPVGAPSSRHQNEQQQQLRDADNSGGIAPFILFDSSGDGLLNYDYYEAAATASSPSASSPSLSPSLSNEDVFNSAVAADPAHISPNAFDPQLLHPGTAIRNSQTNSKSRRTPPTTRRARSPRMMMADRTRSLMALPAAPPQLQHATRRAVSAMELLPSSSAAGGAAAAMAWHTSTGSPMSEYGSDRAHPPVLPPGYSTAEFAQARFIASAGSSSTYDSGSGSEAGTPSDCDMPLHESLTASFIQAAGMGVSSDADSHTPPFVAHGVHPSRHPPAQSGVISSEPDISLLHSLFDVLQPAGSEDVRAPSPNLAQRPLVTMPSPKFERRAMYRHRDAPAALDAAGGPMAAAAPLPVLDMANDLRGLTVTPRSGAAGGSATGYTMSDDVSPLKYFGGSLAHGTGFPSGGGGGGGGGASAGPSVFSPLFATTPSAGAFSSIPLFSPTGASSTLPFSPMTI